MYTSNLAEIPQNLILFYVYRHLADEGSIQGSTDCPDVNSKSHTCTWVYTCMTLYLPTNLFIYIYQLRIKYKIS